MRLASVGERGPPHCSLQTNPGAATGARSHHCVTPQCRPDHHVASTPPRTDVNPVPLPRSPSLHQACTDPTHAQQLAGAPSSATMATLLPVLAEPHASCRALLSTFPFTDQPAGAASSYWQNRGRHLRLSSPLGASPFGLLHGTVILAFAGRARQPSIRPCISTPPNSSQLHALPPRPFGTCPPHDHIALPRQPTTAHVPFASRFCPLLIHIYRRPSAPSASAARPHSRLRLCAVL